MAALGPALVRPSSATRSSGRGGAVLIEIRDLAVTFGRGTPNENPALRGLSLTVGAGEFFTVIGSNGAGKSTLLNAVAGDAAIDGGAIRLGGEDVARRPAHRRARGVARVFQDPMAGTCATLSIEENMALAGRRAGRRGLRRAVRAADRDRFRERLASLDLGLERRLADPVGLLSGGQRQAVTLLMATLAPSQVLLLDEHTAALDPRASALVLALTERIVRDLGLSTLMVTHSLRDALEHGDRLVMLHRGRVIFEAAGDEKRGLTVPDLLDKFGRPGERVADDDRLLLG